MNNKTFVNWFVCIAMMKRVSATSNDTQSSSCNSEPNVIGVSDQHNEMEQRKSGDTQDISSGIQNISLGLEDNPMVDGAANGQTDDANKTHKLGENEVADSNANLQKSSDETNSNHEQYPWECYKRTGNGSVIYYTVDLDPIFLPYRDIFIRHIHKYLANTRISTKNPEEFDLSKKPIRDKDFCTNFSKIYKKMDNNINLANADGDDLSNDWDKLSDYFLELWGPIVIYPERNYNGRDNQVNSIVSYIKNFNYLIFTPYIVHESENNTVIMVVVSFEGKIIGYTFEYLSKDTCTISPSQKNEAVSGKQTE